MTRTRCPHCGKRSRVIDASVMIPSAFPDHAATVELVQCVNCGAVLSPRGTGWRVEAHRDLPPVRRWADAPAGLMGRGIKAPPSAGPPAPGTATPTPTPKPQTPARTSAEPDRR